jgi:outer membrane lipoprotein-sorting protein
MEHVMNRLSPWWLALLFVGTLALSGCLFRSRPVPVRMGTTQLQSATCDELIERINSQASDIRTLKATVSIATSVGGSRRGKVTEYHEIRGYILASKPSLLRMIGLFPILQNRVFDMVSSGHEFRLWIPARNQFIVGNDQRVSSSEPLGNLQPQFIYDALLLQPINQDEVTVLEQGNQTVVDPETRRPVLRPDYTLNIIRRADHGWYLSRKTVFDRADLQPHEQIIYDHDGYVATDAHYEQFNRFNGVSFPTRIEIWRPQEEYSITLTIIQLTVNQMLSDDQFTLNQPPGVELVSR